MGGGEPLRGGVESGRGVGTGDTPANGFPSVPAFDADFDGVPDSWERAYGLDTTRNDALGDDDGDGLSNFAEYQISTSPVASDSNGDGRSDGDDDSDGDGLRNIVEIRANSMPWVSDSDGDGAPGHRR